MFLVLNLLGLSACSAVEPFATIGREAPPDQPAVTGTRLGICYNTLVTSLADVEKTAQAECDKGTKPEQVDTDWYLQNCPLMTPARATFICRPAS